MLQKFTGLNWPMLAVYLLLLYMSIIFMISGLCADEDEDECEAIREKLENIDHVLDDQGIVFVATHELEVAKGRHSTNEANY
jgi:hypothetical protein